MGNGAMRFRKLRIAWSVAWGSVAVLLCVLWVRSYEKADAIYRISKTEIQTQLISYLGVISFRRTNLHVTELSIPVKPHGWKYEVRQPVSEFGFSRFALVWNAKELKFRAPCWCGITLATILGTFPWLWQLKRFSLRTLLIATTLVAVGLGLIVWMSQAD